MLGIDAAFRQIQGEPGVLLKKDILGSTLTTLGVGGPISHLFEVDSSAAFVKLLSALRHHGIETKILGAGSNLIIPDHGISGVVIKFGRGLRYYNFIEPDLIEVGSAMPLMGLAKELTMQGLSGLEFAAGIPATMGGAIRMNSGAHGGEMSAVIDSVEVANMEGELSILRRNELSFSYRHTSIPLDCMITKAYLRLVQSDREQCLENMRKNLDYRKRTQPLQEPSFGSVFKNPEMRSAGSMIEEIGLKGHRVGGAKVSELHANWITNPERKATSKDVLELISYCQEGVRKAFGVSLEPEVVRW